MKKVSYTVGILAALAAGLLTTSTVRAEDGFGPGKMRGEGGGWEEKVNKMYETLGLSEEQRSQLKAQKEEHRSNIQALREKMQAKREEFSQEIQKSDFSADKLKTINNDIKSLHNQMADHRLEGILKVREILTPEQFAKFMDLKEEHKGWGREKFKEKFKEKRLEAPKVP